MADPRILWPPFLTAADVPFAEPAPHPHAARSRHWCSVDVDAHAGWPPRHSTVVTTGATVEVRMPRGRCTFPLEYTLVVMARLQEIVDAAPPPPESQGVAP
ncbi:hypothetical protein JT358_11685 [Micrococcales bacterium 31B]|nr:hypothetical protein [Micrococcales bacterium 31B]